MDDADYSPPQPARRGNPWTDALSYIWPMAALIGLILIAVAYSERGPRESDSEAALLFAGTTLLQFSGVTLVAWIVVSALTWKPQ